MMPTFPSLFARFLLRLPLCCNIKDGENRARFKAIAFSNFAIGESMLAQSTVTAWIEGLRDGSETAAAKLWEHFLQRLTLLVCNRLRTTSKSISDEEDVVLDACEACFRALKAGRYPLIMNRDDLWKMLAVIAERKAIDQIRRSKKGVDGKRVDISFTSVSSDSSVMDGIQQWPCTEPTPEFATVFSENLKNKLSALDDARREVALLKMQGYKNREIAEKIGKAIPTVERYLKLIRETWSDA